MIRGPIARGTIRTSVVLGLRLLVQAGTLLLVARLLGPHDFGAFTGITALAMILGALSTFGTHLVLLAEVTHEPARRDEVLRFAVPTTLLCGAVLLALYLLIALEFLHSIGITLQVLILIGVTEIVLQPLLSLPMTEHLGLGRIARSQLLTVLPLALRLLSAIAVWLLHPDTPLTAYAWGYLAASIIALLVATLTMSGRWPSPHTWQLPDKTELRNAAGYAAINLTAAGPTELDKTLALRFLPSTSAGVYAAGARVIGALTLPVIAMTLSALPRLFREGQADPVRINRLLRCIFGTALAYSVALATALWFSAPLFDWLFGQKYQGLGQTIRWLCLAVPAMALRISAGSVLMALGKPWMRVGYEAIGLTVLGIAAYVMTAHLGAFGMPLALACGEWSMVFVGLVLIRIVRHNAHNNRPGTRAY